MGFTEVLGLANISYSISIWGYLNSWPINYNPWSYVISNGLGYLVKHLGYTKFISYIALLYLYCIISNHTVTGCIVVMTFRCKLYFFTFLCTTYGPIRYTHSLFLSISSASLDGHIPYFIFDRFVYWQVSQLFTFWREYLMPVHYKCWQIVASVISIPGWSRYIWHQFNT